MRNGVPRRRELTVDIPPVQAGFGGILIVPASRTDAPPLFPAGETVLDMQDLDHKLPVARHRGRG